MLFCSNQGNEVMTGLNIMEVSSTVGLKNYGAHHQVVRDKPL